MDNVVQLSNTSENVGRVWLIDEIQVGSSHSVVLSITIKKFDDEDNSIEASILFYDACRFEFSDFTNDAIELEKNSISFLKEIDGFRKILSSDYLDESKNKFVAEYPSRKNPNLSHFVIHDEQNVIQVVSESSPKVIFRNDDHMSEFVPEKVN